MSIITVTAAELKAGDTIVGDGHIEVVSATDHGLEMGFVFKQNGETWCRYTDHSAKFRRVA